MNHYDPKTLAALQKSIRHWKRLAYGLRRKDEGIGPANCALCKMFFSRKCEGCPVMLKSGFPYCRRTPYDAIEQDNMNRMVLSVSKHEQWLNSAEFREMALKELQFLESIL